MSKKIKLLIAEDSAVVATLLRNIFTSDDNISVIGHAKSGVEAVQMTKELKPDLITMDIHMPRMDGFEATRQIMTECPTPIVVISSYANNSEMDTTFKALNAGALTVVQKPEDVLSEGFEQCRHRLLTTIHAMAEVPVIRRRKISLSNVDTDTQTLKFRPKLKIDDVKILALGSSTGGPEALYFMLSQLPKNFPVPIVVVQHISDGFLPGLVKWLQTKSKLNIEIAAKEGQILQPGHVYFAADHQHLVIKQEKHPVASFEDSDTIEHFKPSVTRLFSSLADSYPKQSIGVLLTGMGKDGAAGLLQMKNNGCYTIIQDEKSSIVFGMPGAAKNINAHCEVLDLLQIPNYLNQMLTKENDDD